MSAVLRRAVAVVTFSNICFLSSSQFLFRHIDPYPLSKRETVCFNTLIVALLVSFFRAALTHPGSSSHLRVDRLEAWSQAKPNQHVRFCQKCNNVKPDRWHHCKTCGSCVPKMDHHCIWIDNCVSHRNFPHFIRFLLYSVSAMSYLYYFLFIRLKVIWDSRNLPYYLGPSPGQLAHLLLLIVSASVCLFIMSLILLKSGYGLLMNTTQIERWEIERHEALVERSRKAGGYVYGPGGGKVWIAKQEFPYDVGIWENLKQGMGSANPLAWFWPLAASPPIDDALDWDVNDFEDASTRWPPPDPEKMSQVKSFQKQRSALQSEDFSDRNYIEAFRARQAQDLLRKRRVYPSTAQSNEIEAQNDGENLLDDGHIVGWKDSEGDGLEDFGVDPSAELGEDDIPLSQLIRQRQKRP